MKEEWRAIVGYEGRYEVSSFGRVASLVRRGSGGKPVPVRLQTRPDGYVQVGLWKRNVGETRKVHRLVMAAFVGPSVMHINHLDGEPANNRRDNLEYCTPQQNSRHTIDVLKRWDGPKGDRNYHAVRPNVGQIVSLDKTGLSHRAIARELGLNCHKLVGVVLRGEHWTQRENVNALRPR